MEYRELIIILVALFGIFLTILAMADSGVALESGSWSTVSVNISYFIIYLVVFAIAGFFLKEAYGRR